MANTKKTLLNIGDPSIWIILVPGIRFCNSSPSRTDRNKTISQLRSRYTHTTRMTPGSFVCYGHRLAEFRGHDYRWERCGCEATALERREGVGALQGRRSAASTWPTKLQQLSQNGSITRKATTIEAMLRCTADL